MHNLIKKCFRKCAEKLVDNCRKPGSLFFNTRINFTVPIIKNSYLNLSQLDISGINKETAAYLGVMYLDHRFDLLGSGWVKNSYNSTAIGIEGHKYKDRHCERFLRSNPVKISEKLDCHAREKRGLAMTGSIRDGDWLKYILLPAHIKKSKEIWQFISNDYIPIDWQKDFKSGYRWSAKKFYKDQKVAPKLGVDIKVPWELARLQHLPQLAIFTRILPDLKSNIIKEFRNQVLDFIATNPPRMGVNWRCTMDVAIRAANLLLAYDMFVQIDASGEFLDKDFKRIFSASIHEHALHIKNNLEKPTCLTTNHYLANIAGLLFCSVYLKEKLWMEFSIQELISEVGRQFYKDGGNFEASTSYHRLSSELVIYSVALIFGLDSIDEKFPDWFMERLYRASNFTKDITKPTGEVPQIGDNDSGRFFRLTPNGSFLVNLDAENKYLNLKNYIKLNNLNKNDLFWDENILNHGTLLAAFYGLYNNSELYRFAQQFPLESSLIKNLSKSVVINARSAFCDEAIQKDVKKTGLPPQLIYKKEVIFSLINEVDDLQLVAYFDSGIYIFKSSRMHLTIAACPIGQGGNGGHNHNDKLSFELNILGKDIVRDPGTYLYTALPQKRNLFRSTAAHSCPYHKIEQNNWIPGSCGIFNMFNQSKCKVLDCCKNAITLQVEYKNIIDIAKFNIEADKLIINIYSNKEFTFLGDQINFFSSGYGKLESVVPRNY